MTILGVTMLEVDRVSKRFGALHAVHAVSVSIRPGEVTGLLGPNGAGKTTLIRMITATLAPSTGAISVCGMDTIEQSALARAKIGYLPESAPLYPEMSVEGYLDFRARLYGLGSDARRLAIDRVIERCWLTDRRKQRIGTLSKGYRQRVGLAGAILHEPSVIVLDEPTSGLDPVQIRAMRSLIRELRLGDSGISTGRTVLVSSHILSEVEATCDRVLIMARGKLRAEGTPIELLGGWRSGAAVEHEWTLGVAGSGDPTAIESALRGVPGVNRVDRHAAEGRHRWGVRAVGDVAEPLGRAVHAAGGVVVELSGHQASLEELFMSIVAASEAEDGAASSAMPGTQGVAGERA